jgi:hypothetical protein
VTRWQARSSRSQASNLFFWQARRARLESQPVERPLAPQHTSCTTMRRAVVDGPSSPKPVQLGSSEDVYPDTG